MFGRSSALYRKNLKHKQGSFLVIENINGGNI